MRSDLIILRIWRGFGEKVATNRPFSSFVPLIEKSLVNPSKEESSPIPRVKNRGLTVLWSGGKRSAGFIGFIQNENISAIKDHRLFGWLSQLPPKGFPRNKPELSHSFDLAGQRRAFLCLPKGDNDRLMSSLFLKSLFEGLDIVCHDERWKSEGGQNFSNHGRRLALFKIFSI